MNELVLVKQAEFDGVELDCYVKPKQEDKGDFWATREQIGRLLGYSDPVDAIKKIHKRNAERLDKFSRGDKLSLHEEGRTVFRKVTLYNFKGLLEICRYSHKPKANAVMDWLWEVADEIRRTGSYSLRKKQPQFIQQAYSPNLLQAAEQIIRKAFACNSKADFLEVLALDNVFREFYGKSALDIAHFKLKCHDVYDESLSFEFAHPELLRLREQNERMKELYNCPEYLNLLEEFGHEGTN